MTQLDPYGRALLSYLVQKLEVAIPGKPQTYVTYKKVHDEMDLLLSGPTYGESLKHQGLTNLADWTLCHSAPGITGLIIDGSTYTPGDGYFHLFKKNNEDFDWWREQVEKSKSYDWSEYLNNKNEPSLKSSFESWLIQIGKTTKTAKNYAGAISGSLTKWALDSGLTQESLVDVREAKRILEITEGLCGVEIFQLRNTKGGSMYSCALKSYTEYLRDISSEHIQDDITEILSDTQINDTEKSTLVNARIGQGKYRQQLINHWRGCAVTGYKDIRFLIASHIKPWRESNNQEKLDPYNGLLLLPNLDKVFDLGYISFKEQGGVIVSSELQDMNALGIDKKMSLKVKDNHRAYLEYHRDFIFKG